MEKNFNKIPRNKVNSRTLILHPVLLALFPVLFLFSINVNELVPMDILIPLGGVTLFTILIWFVLGIALKNNKKAGLITSLGLVIFFTYGHIYLQVAGLEFAGITITNAIVVIPFLILFVIGVIFFLKTNRLLDNTTKITNGISVTLLIIVMVNISTFYFSGNNLQQENFSIENLINASNFDYKPDIYYIIFDGYPRSDQLLEHFGYDNGEMITFLEDNQFYVAHNSHANYPITPLSITSAMNMHYFDYFKDIMSIDSQTLHPYKALLDNNKIMQKLKAKGYRAINFDAYWGFDKFLTVSDNTLCRKNQTISIEFLLMLSNTSMLNPFTAAIFEGGHREKILCILSELPKIPGRFKEPVFVYAHIMLPHGPFVFGPNGEKIVPDSMEDVEVSSKTKNDFLNQVKFTDKKIQEIVEKILSDSKTPPIIIIQSDHGSALNVNLWNPDERGLHQRLSILNAYHLPYGADSLLYEDITPVNSFRIVLNYYFNETNPLLDDRIYFTSYKAPYNHTDITDLFIKN